MEPGLASVMPKYPALNKVSIYGIRTPKMSLEKKYSFSVPRCGTDRSTVANKNRERSGRGGFPLHLQFIELVVHDGVVKSHK